MYRKAIGLFISTFLIIQISASVDDFPRIRTPYGTIKGSYKIHHGRHYKAFTGIPYALPPTGDRRFEPPEPTQPWKGELDATNSSKTCVQYSIISDKIYGLEDCLYLNVFVPQVENASALLPVIFKIHGGAFQYGSNNVDGIENLIKKNVILVLPNYRLGPLGFLSTGDEVLPGNMGLKDQSLALRWVSENIKYFGGDPSRITLVGCSAGGASVHFHYLSPLSAGLFRNAISLSGTALAPWAFASRPMDDTEKLASLVNCPTDSPQAMVRCLKALPAVELCKGSRELLMSEYLTIRIDRPPFRPVAENIQRGYFINRSPEEILENHEAYDAPWIAGVVSEEGMILTHGFILNETSLAYVDENWESVGPYLMFLKDEVPKEKHAEVARLARSYYLGNQSFHADDSTFKNLVHLTGDRAFAYGMQKAARLQAKVNKSPVRAYYYNYEADISMSHKLFNNTKNYGVCHCDDVLLMLQADDGVLGKVNDKLMQQKLIDLWYSYAEKGQADIGTYWPEVASSDKLTSADSLQYLNIRGPNKLIIRNTSNFAEKQFWDSIKF